MRSELDHYLEEDVMLDIAHFDILDFLKKDFKYLTLRMIARDILAIPVSTVTSESAFRPCFRWEMRGVERVSVGKKEKE